jgi:hypothetical protein
MKVEQKGDELFWVYGSKPIIQHYDYLCFVQYDDNWSQPCFVIDFIDSNGNWFECGDGRATVICWTELPVKPPNEKGLLQTGFSK